MTKSASGPKKSQNAGTGGNPQGRGPSGRTQYCHATHSETNPFVLITTNNNALWAHDRHQDDEDIIPATNGQCPGGTTTTTEQEPPGGTRVVDDTLTDDGPGPDGGSQDVGAGGPGDDGPGLNGVEGVDDVPGDGRGPAGSDVLGEDESSPGSPAPDDTGPGGDGGAPADVAEETEPRGGAGDGDALPFTGLGLIAILAAALLALGSGLTVRRFTGRRQA